MGPSWVWVLSKNLRPDPRPGPVRNPAPKITKIPCIYIYIFLYSNPNPSFLHSSAADIHTPSVLTPHLSLAVPHFSSVQHSLSLSSRSQPIRHSLSHASLTSSPSLRIEKKTPSTADASFRRISGHPTCKFYFFFLFLFVSKFWI